MTFIPKHSNYKEKVTKSFNRQPFMDTIGAVITKLEPGYCELELDYNKKLSQQHGFFHAGIVGAIADNAAGYAGFTLMGENSSVLTVEFKLNLLAPADGGKLIAKAHVLKNGKTLTICRTDVYYTQDKELRLCAAAQVTLIELNNTMDKPK